MEEDSEQTSAIGKCTKQFALNAELNARFLSNPPKANPFFAETALERREDSNALK